MARAPYRAAGVAVMWLGWAILGAIVLGIGWAIYRAWMKRSRNVALARTTDVGSRGGFRLIVGG